MSYKAVVKDGKAIITNLEEFPNETILEFEIVQNDDEDDDFTYIDDSTDNLDEEQKAALHAALQEGLEQAGRGEVGVSVEDVLKRL